MRALLVADAVGGVRTFIAELARGLSGAGLEVHLALLAPGGTPRPEVPQAASVQFADLRLEWMPDAGDDVPAAAEWVAGLCRRIRPDVLHMNTFTPVLDPHVPVLLCVHSCVLSWWRAVHSLDAPPEWDHYRALAGAAIARAGLVVVPTRGLLAALAEVHGELPGARVIANGRRVSVPALPRDERLVVTVGRLWDAAKNVTAVAAAAPAIRGRVVALGAGRVPGLECLGERPEADVAAWLARATVFAEPARYEPFGLSALEAAMCGCALVLGDIPSLREVWGEAADYVAPDDPEALAAAVNRLLGDPRHRGRMLPAVAARAARYTPEATAQAYLDAYTRVLRQRALAVAA